MTGATYVVVLISCLLGVESLPRQDSSLGIIGGHTVNITEAPFMARYRNLEMVWFCSATIIHPRFVASSAYCYYLFQPYENISLSYVTVSTDDVKNDGPYSNVINGYPHPKHKKNHGIEYDLVLLKLEKTLDFNERVKAIALPDKQIVIPEGAKFDTLGYGVVRMLDDFYGLLAEKLQKVTVPYVNNKKCKQLFSNLTDNMICAFGDGVGSCYLDDGGPLIYNNTLLGIVSFGDGCGDKGVPNIYTYIPALLQFIDSVIGTDS